MSLRPHGIKLFIEMTFKALQMNEIQLLYDLLAINTISSSLPAQFKKFYRPHLAPGPQFALSELQQREHVE